MRFEGFASPDLVIHGLTLVAPMQNSQMLDLISHTESAAGCFVECATVGRHGHSKTWDRVV